MDPAKASAKVLQIRKPDTVLVCFFADNEFNWLPPSSIAGFEVDFAERSRQRGTKLHKVTIMCKHVLTQCRACMMLRRQHCIFALQKFNRAVEEAQELQDRRSGTEPKTSHQPPGVHHHAGS
jgi:hypothetical protein